jgi:hypothetical protein
MTITNGKLFRYTLLISLMLVSFGLFTKKAAAVTPQSLAACTQPDSVSNGKGAKLVVIFHKDGAPYTVPNYTLDGSMCNYPPTTVQMSIFNNASAGGKTPTTQYATNVASLDRGPTYVDYFSYAGTTDPSTGASGNDWVLDCKQLQPSHFSLNYLALFEIDNLPSLGSGHWEASYLSQPPQDATTFVFNVTNGITTYVVVNWVTDPTGNIEGWMVGPNVVQSASPSPLVTGTVTVSGIGATSAQPYIDTVPVGTYTVTATAPAGYVVAGYTHTQNYAGGPVTGHGDADIVAASSVTLTVTSGNREELWWHFRPVDKPPTGVISGSCSGGITGWAEDPDSLGTSLSVQIQVDGVTVQVVTANQPDSKGTSHGFTIAYPGAIDGNTHTIGLVALGVDYNGAPNGNNVVAATVSVNTLPCYNSPPVGTATNDCTTISGTASDPDWSVLDSVNLYIAGALINGSPLPTAPVSRAYSYPIPLSYLDGVAHTVDVQTVDYNKVGTPLGYVSVASTTFTCGEPTDTVQNRVHIACTINGHILDPSSPSSSLMLGVSVDGGAYFTDPTWMTDTSASQLPPDQDNIGPGSNGISITSYFGDYNTHTITLIAYGVNSAGVPDGVNTTWGPTAVSACTPSCSSSSPVTVPSNPEANQPFTITNMGWSYKQGSLSGSAINSWAGYTISISIPDASFNGSAVPPGYSNAAAEILFTFPTVGTGGSGDLTAPLGNFVIANAGLHQITMTIKGPQFTLICSSAVGSRTVNTGTTPVTVTDNWNTISIVNKPYMKVFAGDVSAGGGFKIGSSACTAANSIEGGIKTWGVGSSGLWTGSSVEYAAFAINTIDSASGRGFYSGSQAHDLASYNGMYTSFANTVGPLGGTFDAANGHCVPDYYATTKLTSPAPTLIASAFSYDVCAQATNGVQYITSGSITLNACAGFNKRVTIYVPGNVFIAGTGIQYAPYTTTSTTMTSSVPYLTIVALGSIFINSSVRNLDGLYIAQSESNGVAAAVDSYGNKGTIYTCATGLSSVPSTGSSGSTIFATCSVNQLTVNGGLVAKYIAMERASGTVSSALSSETASVNGASETYIQGPESYLGAPLFKPVLNSILDSKPGVQSDTSLSPLF